MATTGEIVLETGRLALRKLTLNDAAFMLELLNEPAFIKYVADRGIRTEADAARYLAEKLLPSYDEFGFGFYLVALKDDRQPIGICGLIKRPGLEQVDVGFSFLHQFWGNGYAFESASAVMEYGRRVYGLDKIVAVTSPENHSSIKLIEKLGLQFQELVHLPGYGSASKLFA